MKEFNHYSIPLVGILDGAHQFEFKVDKSFFEKFEKPIVEDGLFQVKVDLIKQPDAMFLTFHIDGTMKADCDRCLATIDLPIQGKYDLIAKYAAEASETDEVIYIVSDQQKLELQKSIYDFIGLSIPLVKTYNCEDEEPRVCDDAMLDKIEGTEEAPEEEPKSSPIWDALKDFGKN